MKILIKRTNEKNNYWNNQENTFQTYPVLAQNILNCVKSGGEVYFVTNTPEGKRVDGPVVFSDVNKNGGFTIFSVKMAYNLGIQLSFNPYLSNIVTKFYENPGIHGLIIYDNGRTFSININTPPPRI